MRLSHLVRALVLASATLAGCFTPDEPVCSYACGDNNACPTDYECRPDGYCHKLGTTGMCDFSDLSATVDMSVAPDLAQSIEDGSTSD